jgi:hypothetical protein
MPKPPTSVRSIRLPDTLWGRLAALAGEADTVNALVHLAVKRQLDAWESAGAKDPALARPKLAGEEAAARKRRYRDALDAVRRIDKELQGMNPKSLHLPKAPPLKVGDVVTGLGAEPQRVAKVGRVIVQLGPIHAKPGERAKRAKR